MADNRAQHITASDLAADMRKTVDDTKAFAKESIDETKRAVTHYGELAKKKASEVKGASETYIKENPWKSVLGALGVGVVVGLLIGARRR